MARVLVTGGAGYIGSHTVQKLLLSGHKVAVIDNLSTGFKEAVPNQAEFYFGDVRDSNFVAEIMSKFDAEVVIHFAAKLNVAESLLKPVEYYDNNVGGTLSLLKACEKSGVKNFIFSSTAAVYGDSCTDGIISEGTPTNPLNPYGWSKLISEKLLSDTGDLVGINHVIFRYFNVAGAAEDGSNGQRTANAYHLVHLASQAGVGKRQGLKIFGTDYPTPDGTCIRDYIHVEDLADIHVLGAEHLLRGGTSATLNCGYGQGYSVREVISSALNVAENKFPVEEADRRPGDPASLVADSRKMQALLGWTPRRNNIDTICRTALNWEKTLSK
ncbi:UDP-glucose 4-epimerase GalE [Bdellovibrio sp. HCB-162]|uniref:UDP-glucose 4-epimerase GalE n=1 Tax=Bdellovibrio sp. HCB-162 TaxID=3394234 RepID=UPI0039BD26E6